MEWKPIETAPKVHGFVALLRNGRQYPFVGIYDTEACADPVWVLELSGDEYGLSASPQPTHWMPAPSVDGEVS